MNAIIITTCTNRKRKPPHESLLARNLQKSDVASVAEQWIDRLNSGVDRFPLEEMYIGRGFREAESTADTLNGELWVLSAGLGIVTPDAPIPSYGLTLSTSAEDCVFKRFVGNVSPRDWWGELTSRNKAAKTFKQLLEVHHDVLVLMACSVGYLEMISAELDSLPDRLLDRLRIIGPQDTSIFSEAIAEKVMPYDYRFDGEKCPNPGTRSDFAQRALRHFADNFMTSEKAVPSAREHAEMVRGCISSWPYPKKVKRAVKTDEEIIQLVPDMWERAQGSSGKMLRVLRDQELVACEQGRFAKLFKTAKERYAL